MDGPLLVRLHSEGELWAFECIEEKLKGTVVEERGHAVPRQVLTSLRDAARATIEACTKKQLYSSDLDTLMRLRDELEELLLAQAVH